MYQTEQFLIGQLSELEERFKQFDGSHEEYKRELLYYTIRKEMLLELIERAEEFKNEGWMH